jgi:hypothetical protein
MMRQVYDHCVTATGQGNINLREPTLYFMVVVEF